MQGNRRFFFVTAIFSGHFLTNMPKFQKLHFFLRRIYIIIEGRTEPRNVFRGVIPAVMAQETPPKRFRKPKRYRERCQIPVKCRTNGLAPYRYRIKRGKHHGKQGKGQHRGHTVCHRHHRFGKVHPRSCQKAGRGHHKAAGHQ